MNPRQFSKSNLFRAIVLLAIFGAFAFWNPEPLNAVFRGAFHTVFLPVERLFSSVGSGIRDTAGFLSDIGDLKRENERLVEENLRLTAERASLQFLRAENEELREASGLELRNRFELLPSETVSYDRERGTVLISSGSMRGVRTGMPVLSSSGVLVGTVGEAYPTSAEIRLLTSSLSAVGGITVESGTKGVVRGARGLGATFSMVSRPDPLLTGDRVVTSGAGGIVPSGLFIGVVNSVQDTSDMLFREATISIPEDPERLRFLFVIVDENDV